MKKQVIKVIKQGDGVPKKIPPAANKPSKERPKKPRSLESTVKDWITERRENDDAENRSRNSQLAEWDTDTDPVPAESA